jgi:hypothetical protein
MNANWIDRMARVISGAREQPRARSVVPATDETAFSRTTALRSAAVFGLAAMVPALRPPTARADACADRCRADFADTLKEAFTVCVGGKANFATAATFLPFVAAFRAAGCSSLYGPAWLINDNLCETDESYRAPYCGNSPSPPQAPRTRRTYPPTKPKPLNQPGRKKAPPTKRTRPRGTPKPPPGACSGPGHCCPTKLTHSGWVPCALGCAKSGDGCCIGPGNQPDHCR